MCGYVWCEDVYVRVKGYVGESGCVNVWVRVRVGVWGRVSVYLRRRSEGQVPRGLLGS